jgi:hypothetical protein
MPNDSDVAYLDCMEAQEALYWEARRRGWPLNDKEVGDILRLVAPILAEGLTKEIPSAKLVAESSDEGNEMAERITRADLDRIAESVSASLPASVQIDVQGRNGYVALDLSDSGQNLFIGTTRECYTYLQGMRRAQILRRAS